jgi:protein-L-isoaspartate(D-aspartate) O-methyltransferase
VESETRMMVKGQISSRGVKSRRVLAAMLKVDRRYFVPEGSARLAYGDHPVPIGMGQTISQPYMVAIMLDLLDVHRGMKVLEVGAGSGYVLALLRAMGARPYGIEWHRTLAEAISENLRRASIPEVPVRAGDGGLGWPEEAPFDRILVSAACPDVPKPLLDQLAPGGELLAPVNEGFGQVVVRLMRTPRGFEEEYFDRCVFVPLLGRYGTGARGPD